VSLIAIVANVADLLASGIYIFSSPHLVCLILGCQDSNPGSMVSRPEHKRLLVSLVHNYSSESLRGSGKTRSFLLAGSWSPILIFIQRHSWHKPVSSVKLSPHKYYLLLSFPDMAMHHPRWYLDGSSTGSNNGLKIYGQRSWVQISSAILLSSDDAGADLSLAGDTTMVVTEILIEWDTSSWTTWIWSAPGSPSWSKLHGFMTGWR